MAELSRAIARLMEERKRDQPPQAAPAPRPAEPEPIEPVVDQTRERVAPGERALAEAFVRQFATAPGAEALEDAELSALAMVAFRFVSDRSAEEPRLRVFDADLAHEGWSSAGTVIQVAMRERPFIVSTIQLCLAELDCQVRRILAPVFSIERDPRRVVLAIGPPGPIGAKEILVHIEIERGPEPQVLTTMLSRRLSDLILATEDYGPMRTALDSAVEQLRARTLTAPWREEAEETAAFLEWLGQDNFVFLGYREYKLEGQGADRTAAVRRGSGLGILQAEDQSSFATPARLPDGLRRRINEPPLLMITKTNAESPVHRRGYMDYLGLKEIDEAGVVAGERRWIGLFSTAGLAALPSATPLLRQKLARVLTAEGLAADSDEAATVTRLFDRLPKVDLMALAAEELRSEIRAIRTAGRSGDVQVSYRADAIERGVLALITMPRPRFSHGLYGATEQRVVRATNATAVLDRTLVDVEGEPVRMHFYLNAPPELVLSVPARELEAPVLSVLRTWEDRLREQLGKQHDRHRAGELADRYLPNLPAEYRRDVEVEDVVRDIQMLEELRSDRHPHADVLAEETSSRQGWVKIYCLSQQL
ncbi:MAG TPA: hypothetical protein VEB21_08725, partial [Terriglobales bacterium]|nr:hypothetical protein [Terriglobales bacterium]